MTAISAGETFAEERSPDDTIILWPSQPKITLEVFLPKSNRNGTGVIVCPGGGYCGLCKTYEGYDVADWLNSIGITAFVLNYHIDPEPNTVLYPWPIKDGRKAISFVHANAAKYNLKQNQIGILGFSAGGHLASSIGTHWQKPDADDIVNDASCRPDFMILLYPVISFQKQYTHKGSRDNLIGRDANDAQVNEFSNEMQVNANTPPTFIIHAADDDVVPVENTLMFFTALKNAGVQNCEMHIFSKGGHGFGMGFREGRHCDWSPNCTQWLKNLKLVE
ncbi:MAG: alpha/beta hydrolase [Planctomycetaceae bacterium]|nr:alpha/beta hydrolase [Planctomycetaceae bacterium]